MIELYTRRETCLWCIKAKEKLNAAHYDFTEIVVGEGISRDDFIVKFWNNVPNPRPTAPQIVVNGRHVGGFEELNDWLKFQERGDI